MKTKWTATMSTASLSSITASSNWSVGSTVPMIFFLTAMASRAGGDTASACDGMSSASGPSALSSLSISCTE